MEQAINRATKRNVDFVGLRWLHREQMRRVYQTYNTPVVGYAYLDGVAQPAQRQSASATTGTVQPKSLIRILSAFRTVATFTLEVEAYVLPTHLRLRHRAQNTIMYLHTLCRDHPIWPALLQARKRRNDVRLHTWFPLATYLRAGLV